MLVVILTYNQRNSNYLEYILNLQEKSNRLHSYVNIIKVCFSPKVSTQPCKQAKVWFSLSWSHFSRS